VNVAGVEELVADKGYHSGAVLAETRDVGVRTYIPERKQTGKRNWRGKEAQRQAVYANRRRVQGDYGKRLLKKRGELVERSFAHCYDTGGMRRTHLRKHDNILKRQLIHVGAFNLSLILRQLLGAGTPRELRNRATGCFLLLIGVLRALSALQERFAESIAGPTRLSGPGPRQHKPRFCCRNWRGSTTGC
jgi:transposase